MARADLAMSRAIGNLNAKVQLVATPEVIEHRVDTAHDDYLIIASDGVREFIREARRNYP